MKLYVTSSTGLVRQGQDIGHVVPATRSSGYRCLKMRNFDNTTFGRARYRPRTYDLNSGSSTSDPVRLGDGVTVFSTAGADNQHQTGCVTPFLPATPRMHTPHTHTHTRVHNRAG